MSTENDSGKCADLREDYFECLHHKKEVRACVGGAAHSRT